LILKLLINDFALKSNKKENKIDKIIVSQCLPAKKPPKPSAQMELKKSSNLRFQLFSVIEVPPKSVKCPIVCFEAAVIKSFHPVTHTNGKSHTKIPIKNE
tara:strand:+ start:195 stop:494 length:300 start_codon:yes stop_codon:yes gene_type:complete